MFNYLIYEDDPFYVDLVTSTIKRIHSSHGHSFNCQSFSCPSEDLFKQIKENPIRNLINIYLLDIHMSEHMNGIELAQFIRKHDINAYIIFLTGHIELSYQILKKKLEVLDFIHKGGEELDLSLAENINLIIERFNDPKRYPTEKSPGTNTVLSFNLDTGIVRLESSEIMMFETETKSRKIIIHTETGRKYTAKGKMTELEKNLPKSFIRCHRSYIINSSHITRLVTSSDHPFIELNSNLKCYISARKISALKKNLMTFS